MANRTVTDAKSVRGTNPQYLVEKIIRTRVYESKYWKEHCFALTAELLVDKAMDLTHVGGTYGGNSKSTPFLCLVLKMLQIQPEKEIIVEFIKNDEYKYVRALGALYMRLVGTSLDCYNYLEPLYNDYRKLKRMNTLGKYEVVHMDEFIDELLHEERVIDILLPRIQLRQILETSSQLEPRRSALEGDLEDLEESESEDEEMKESPKHRSPSPHRSSRRRSASPPRRRSRSPHSRRSRSRSPHRRRKSPSPHRHRRRHSRSRSRSPRRRSRSPRSRHDKHDKHDKHRSRSRSPKHKRRDDKRDDRREEKSKKSSKNMTTEELEIQEANELRAKLGLKPLRP